MTVHFDPKGKYFTEVIRKVPMPATIQTIHHRIHGVVYIRPNYRLIDELEQPAGFLAVTDAEILDPPGDLKAAFMVISKHQIIWIIPDEESLAKRDDIAG